MSNLERLLGPNYQITQNFRAQLMDPIQNVRYVQVYLPREGWLAFLFRPVRVRLFQMRRIQARVM